MKRSQEIDFNIENLILNYNRNFKVKGNQPYEPLDGDEVDLLVEHIRNEINLSQGNITYQEYQNLEEKINGRNI